METLELRHLDRVGAADAFQRLLDDTDDRHQGGDEHKGAADCDLWLGHGEADERSRDIELFPGRVTVRRSEPPRRKRDNHRIEALAIFIAAGAIAFALFALLGWLCQP